MDKILSKSPKVMITKLDLTQVATQQLVLEWIRMPQVKAVFVAPPCGTASRARTIKIAGEENLPQPLRTADQPDGVDNLEGWDFLRVESNQIFYMILLHNAMTNAAVLESFSCAKTQRIHSFGIQPLGKNDNTKTWTASRHTKHVPMVPPGQNEPKAANFHEVCLVNKICPGDHPHEPWGVQRSNGKRCFATSLEVHYPQQLCDAIANAILAGLHKQGISPAIVQPLAQAARAFSNVQTSANKLPPVVSEYKCLFAAVFHDSAQVWPKYLFSGDYKLLHEFDVGGEDVQQLCNRLIEQCAVRKVDVKITASELGSLSVFPCAVKLKIFGLFWNEVEFIKQAIEAEHPMDPLLAVPEELRDAISHNLLSPDHVIASERTKFLSCWTARAKALDAEERALKSGMDPIIANAVSKKRISVVEELRCGSDLIGEVPTTNMLPGKFTPALATETKLRSGACRVRSLVLAESTGSGDDEIDQVVWNKTMEEVEKGWLAGPLEDHQIPATSPISRRFGLRQKKGKVRLIDDFSESGVNKCVTSVESPVLHTIDIACAALTFWFGESYMHGADSTLVVRTYDLASAYRQVALSQSGREFACIRVFDPEAKRMRIFRCLVLPFGAIRSVHSFLRLARAIWWIGVRGCKLLWTSFYDDYIAYSRPSLASNMDNAIVLLFRLLGWIFAESGDKSMPFGKICDALGVTLNLSNSAKGLATVCNTASRVTELCDELMEVITAKKLSSKMAQRLRGRMQFAESQMFGRTGRRCLKVLSSFAEGHKQKLNDKDIFSWKCLCNSFKATPLEKLDEWPIATLTSVLQMRATNVTIQPGPVALGVLLALDRMYNSFQLQSMQMAEIPLVRPPRSR